MAINLCQPVFKKQHRRKEEKRKKRTEGKKASAQRLGRGSAGGGRHQIPRLRTFKHEVIKGGRQHHICGQSCRGKTKEIMRRNWRREKN